MPTMPKCIAVVWSENELLRLCLVLDQTLVSSFGLSG